MTSDFGICMLLVDVENKLRGYKLESRSSTTIKTTTTSRTLDAVANTVRIPQKSSRLTRNRAFK